MNSRELGCVGIVRIALCAQSLQWVHKRSGNDRTFFAVECFRVDVLKATLKKLSTWIRTVSPYACHNFRRRIQHCPCPVALRHSR